MFKIVISVIIIYSSKRVWCVYPKIECGYKQCPQTRDGALNVHLIPHSHMDAGWVKTFDEYYYGTRTSISTANVHLIFHSVLSELLHDKRRKFTFSETGYFWRWWKEQRPATRTTFRTLVQEGRIEFAGGGWTQNDEATVDYLQIIDHFTWGLRKLNDTLGPCGKPKASWQIDTYGHSREMTSLLAQMGFDGLFIGRVDHKERESMIDEDRMEYMWRGSDVLGKMSDIMTHTLFNLYNAPEGFCFDFLCSDEPIVDDPENPEYNAGKRVNEFIVQIERQAKYYDHDNIVVTMGGDFTYQSAANWFMNMDKLINHVNTHPGNISDVNIFYSTPSCYLKAIYLYGRRDKAIYTEKGDHMPYGSDSSTYWTGYYSSRPSLKYFVRKAHVFLQVVKQLTVIARMGDSFELHLLRHAANLVLHHDAITGTSQQHVTNDFVRMLTDAVDACTKKLSNLLSYLTPTWGGTRRSKNSQQFVVCHELNISQCRFTETQESMLLIVYNPLSIKTYHHVRLPAIALHYTIRDWNDEEVEYQLVPLPAAVINLPGRSSTVIQELYFEAENIPPLGYSSYYIAPVRDQLEENEFAKKHIKKDKGTDEKSDVITNIANEYLKVTANKNTGMLESIQHVDGVKVDISQNFYYYSQAQQAQQSGAYCFRPENTRPTPITEQISDNDVSYEDDFESYESDFNSYHSERSENSSTKNDNSRDDEQNEIESDQNDHITQTLDEKDGGSFTDDSNVKEGKDEEKMLDSGNFDLRDRSAKTRPPVMEFILEDGEDDKRTSLTDEGFQDMSSSSAVSTMKTHVDVLDKPLFIDFTKSKETKRKRKLNEKLKLRATDLLSMITLHEMSYNLFEMKPIPYDLYMATFGRANYTQIAVQTFDDGITEEIQTEDILVEHKWTQHPIEFSKHDVYLYPEVRDSKYGKNNEDYLSKFTFLINKNTDVEKHNKINMDKDYKENPLRIYFEQKDGVGTCEILPYETYKNKIENNDFNAAKLRKFLKKVEGRVSSVLNLNTDKNLIQFKNSLNQKIPLSKGYLTITPKSITNEHLSFVKNSKVSNVIFSETKSNLIMLVHRKSLNNTTERCVICLWDISIVMKDPVKILVAIDNLSIGKFKGSTDGIFVAALEDGSLHLWDLSEEPTWRNDTAIEEELTNVIDVNSEHMTKTELEREWNLKNVNVFNLTCLPQALQACAFTNSAGNMTNGDVIDHVVGLEFVGDGNLMGNDGGRKIVGQICTLQRIGILTIWSIVQEKAKTLDKGKAYWSKMKLEKTQTISLIDHLDLSTKMADDEDIFMNFNLNAAKRRLSNKKVEKDVLKKDIARPKSTSSSEFDISRPASAVSLKRVMSLEKKVHQGWESGLLCSDLKIMSINKRDSYLVAKNCGEVLCCTRIAGAVKVERFCVTTDTSTVTCLGVSPHGLPYFLAATDSGTINLCAVLEARVLLTLDCRNGPPSDAGEKCQSDHKGRFVSTSKVRSQSQKFETKLDSKLPITFLHWSPSNPCSIYTLLQNSTLSMWDLTHSDIWAKSVSTQAAVACAAEDGVLVAQKATFTVIRGAIVKEIRQRFTDWATQVIRLYRGEEFVEIEWIVGPIPIGTDLGKEVVSIFSTNITTGGQFYTDSNARQMMKRSCWNESTVLPQKKPVAACYYPVVSRICLQSNNSSTGLCVLTDRAQGGTSYREGEIELMVHRRLLTDDGFGLEESLNEEAYGVGLVVSGKHRIVFGNIRQEVEDLSFSERVAAAARRWQLEPWLFMTAADKVNRRKWQNVRNKRYSALRLHGVPRHIHVLTLEPWKGGSVLLRLENTLEKAARGRLRNERADGPEGFVNKPSHITVQLRQLFIHLKIKRVRETTLAANQWLDDARQMDWSTRYVYQGADDEIFAEDNVEYKDDSKPVKDRQDEEKDYKEPANYSEEEEFNRRTTPGKQKKKSKTKSKQNFDEKYDNNYRRRRSVNISENVLENVINSTFNDKYNEKFTHNRIEAPNNTIEDHEFVTSTNKVPVTDNEFVTTEMALDAGMDITSNVTILPGISIPSYPFTYHTNVKEKHVQATRRPRNFNSHRSSKQSRKRKNFANLAKSVENNPSSEEDFAILKKRTPKRRKINKNARKERRTKGPELPRTGPDDGITKSMFEMYYKSKPSSKARTTKPPPVEVQATTEAPRKKGRRKLKMRRYKGSDDYGDGGRSNEAKKETHRIDYEEIVIPDVKDIRDESEEGGKRKTKIVKKAKQFSADMPFFITDGRRSFGTKKRAYDEDSTEGDDKDGISRMEMSRMRSRREREFATPDHDDGAAVDNEDSGDEERDPRRVKRAAAAAEEPTDAPTVEATEPPEEPDYIITLRPTQIRTFVIFFENNSRAGTAYSS